VGREVVVRGFLGILRGFGWGGVFHFPKDGWARGLAGRDFDFSFSFGGGFVFLSEWVGSSL
jgi:hypothetical protein